MKHLAHVNLVTDAELHAIQHKWRQLGAQEGLAEGYRLGKQDGIDAEHNRHVSVEVAQEAHKLLRELGLD